MNRFLIPLIVAPFQINQAKDYGEIRSELEQKGESIGPLDNLIVAHAKSLGLTLVTNDEKEFSRVKGLRIENWTKV